MELFVTLQIGFFVQFIDYFFQFNGSLGSNK